MTMNQSTKLTTIPAEEEDLTVPANRSFRTDASKVRFWGIFASLCVLAFISALDVAIITTALPKITEDIGGASQYVWIANSFVVASSVPQPLLGQLANTFGRRLPFVGSIMLFITGSGIAGGASTAAMLIAGRTVQGVGAGGIYVLLDIVCCDLVPLRQRGKYLGLMFSWSGVAAALGPVVGGALAQVNWRWIFYLNIPICGIALVGLLCFMRVKVGTADQADLGTKLTQIDWLGYFIFVPSLVALLYGLVTGGVLHPWSSWRVILPLVLGVVGWAIFHVQQSFTKTPSIPGRLFSNRTSATAFILTFLSSVLVQSISYFLPIYFQAVLGTTILQSGINFLPFAIGTLVSAVVSGILLSKFGAYRPLHAVAFALSVVGFGLFTLLDSDTSKVAWVFFQLIAAVGSGLTLSVMLPAIMAALPESDVASASAAYSFVRTFGYVWGVMFASIVFNASFDRRLDTLPDQLQDLLKDGKAYSYASQVHLDREKLSPNVWHAIELVYNRSLRTIWWVGLGISGLSFFLVGLEKGIELRKDLDTQYGLDADTPCDKEAQTKEATSSVGD